LIAGLGLPDSGVIYLEGELIFSKDEHISVPSNKREIGIVFQNYALWPHMDIFKNVSYPLKVKNTRREYIKKEVTRALSLVQLDGLGKRFPHELSSGQQQCVALARALIMRPKVLLLDEALSNLDAKLREKMQFEICRIHKETGITTVHVTHDQSEAMAITDSIAVMKDGKLIQVGNPEKIYTNPETAFIAQFIGTTNLISCRVENINGRKVARLADGSTIESPVLENIPLGQVTLSVRPENIQLSHNGSGMTGKITHAVYLGNTIDYWLSVGDMKLRSQTTPPKVFSVGENVHLNITYAIPMNLL